MFNCEFQRRRKRIKKLKRKEANVWESARGKRKKGTKRSETHGLTGGFQPNLDPMSEWSYGHIRMFNFSSGGVEENLKTGIILSVENVSQSMDPGGKCEP